MDGLRSSKKGMDSFKKVCGESTEVDAATVKGWRKEQLKTLLEKYESDDAFNADEMALYYKLLPDKSLVLKGKKNAHKGTCSKQRLIVLAANMMGTKKLPLL